MRLYCCIIALLLMACAHGKSTGPLVFDEAGPGPSADLSADPPPDTADLRAVRWHLLLAIESHALGQTQRAQEALDAAIGILADLDEHDALVDTVQAATLGLAIERAYLDLLPHLERLPADSHLNLLLEGLAEEKVEHLLADAEPLVRIRQLGRRCDMPIDANDRVVASLHFFQTRGRKTFATWLQRAGRYRTLIVDILRREGMPSDLFYLAVIESGLNPRAYSRARAVGLWQFMAHTGRMMGLERTHWIDERRDPIKATVAAARYLKDHLLAEFGDWRLALAAYNAGPGRVRRAIARADTNDYWQLDLPRETKNYVPLFMAAAVIAKDPQLFGFEPQAEEPAFTYEEVVLPADWPYVDLKAAAQLLGIERQVLHDLNPELRQDMTPPGSPSYVLRVPRGKKQLLLDQYASLPAPQKAAVHRYQVQRGDTISGIAQAFGVSTQVIAAANSLRNPHLIRPRQMLYIPIPFAPKAKQARSSRGTYTVQPNDVLGRIASQHGVRLRDLMKWNGLKTTLIKPGQELVVRRQPIPGATYTVQPGDTLWELARHFSVSVNDLKVWNGLKTERIKPGQQLIVANAQAYTVVTGDTLHSIARKFGLAPGDIARQNNIGLSETLLAGTTLQIPR